MKSLVVPASEAKEIEKRVQRLLAAMGNPKPPIRLDDVRAIQKLDIKFYSLQNPDFLDRMAHKMRVAGKILTEPIRLVEAVKQMDLKALLLPDSKKILIDDDLHKIKKRWAEGHEIVHDLLDWHKDFMYGESQFTLSPFCEEMIEAEANYGAGMLLYPPYFFNDYVAGQEISISLAKKLATDSGNSITSAGWRLAENSATPAFFMVSDASDVQHLVVSDTFESGFSKVRPSEIVEVLRANVRRGRGPLGTFGVKLRDDTGTPHNFLFDAFNNQYSTLTLGRKSNA